MNIQENAVLVTLSVSRWSAHALDKEISKEIVASKGLQSEDMCRAWKTLIPRNKFLSAINGAASQARKFNYRNTFEWVHEGPRVLPVKNYLAYTKYMRRAKARFEKAVEEFLKEYETLQLAAKTALNSMFKQSDYPSVESLRSKFCFSTFTSELPSGNSIPKDVGTEEADRIRADIERDLQETFRAANQDLWGRLHAVIKHMEACLSSPTGVKPASLNSLREALALLDRLNLTGDERLERMRKQAEARISLLSGGGDRITAESKEAAIAEAKKIQSSMAAFMAAA